jgi:hypothetical protein
MRHPVRVAIILREEVVFDKRHGDLFIVTRLSLGIT